MKKLLKLLIVLVALLGLGFFFLEDIEAFFAKLQKEAGDQ